MYCDLWVLVYPQITNHLFSLFLLSVNLLCKLNSTNISNITINNELIFKYLVLLRKKITTNIILFKRLKYTFSLF